MNSDDHCQTDPSSQRFETKPARQFVPVLKISRCNENESPNVKAAVKGNTEASHIKHRLRAVCDTTVPRRRPSGDARAAPLKGRRSIQLHTFEELCLLRDIDWDAHEHGRAVPGTPVPELPGISPRFLSAALRSSLQEVGVVSKAESEPILGQ
jgi:hypothetical protein